MGAYTCERCGHAIDNSEGFGWYWRDSEKRWACGRCIAACATLGVRQNPERIALLERVRNLLIA